MSLGLEFTGEYGVVQRNFDKLGAEVLGTGGIDADLRFGVGTITWPGASTISNGLSVTHGLGKIPVAVIAVAQGSTGLNTFPVLSTQSYGATTFAVFAGTVDAQTPLNTATTTIAWVAIG